ncbi:MAG: hypothetical protein K0A93_06010 [Desulfuromonadaceae bacterium]|nr:hypothetical protein [Desulfuromonadaceae bacterium]
MRHARSLIAVCFTSGVAGGLAVAVLAWLCSEWGVTTLASVKLSARLDLYTLYSTSVWGGLWGLLYYFTVGHVRSRRRWARKGLWVSLIPSGVQLLYIYPYLTGHGLLGLKLGALTPVFIIGYNLLWGLVTGIVAWIFWGRD